MVIFARMGRSELDRFCFSMPLSSRSAQGQACISDADKTEEPDDSGITNEKRRRSGATEHVDDDDHPESSATTLLTLAGQSRPDSSVKKQAPFWHTLRVYTKAIGWVTLISMVFALDGYESAVTSGLYTQPSFQRYFGMPSSSEPSASPDANNTPADRLSMTSYALTAAWQGGLNNGSYIGELIGLLVTGWLSERFGLRVTLATALAAACLLIPVQVFARSVSMLLAARIVVGVPWAIFSALAATYAAELLPAQVRAQASSIAVMASQIGGLLGYGVVHAVSAAYEGGIEEAQATSVTGDHSNEWTFRIPYALQWAIAVPLLVFAGWLAPESPWWLVRKAGVEDARRTLTRLRSVDGDTKGLPMHRGRLGMNDAHESRKANGIDEKDNERMVTRFTYSSPSLPTIDETLEEIVRTDERERRMQSGSSYLDCFRRWPDRRRTEVCCASYVTILLSGTSLSAWSTYFLGSTTSLTAQDAYRFGMIRQAVGVFAVAVSWVLMAHFGRRTLQLTGLSLICSILLALGALGAAEKKTTDAGNGHVDGLWYAWSYGALFVVYKLVFDATIVPVVFAIVAEIPSTRLRQRTVVLARLLLVILQVSANTITPYMINPMEWNWGARAGFFWACTTALCFVWVYFRLPEPKGRSFGELDLLFENAVAARDFRRTNVSALDMRCMEPGAGVSRWASTRSRKTQTSFREEFVETLPGTLPSLLTQTHTDAHASSSRTPEPEQHEWPLPIIQETRRESESSSQIAVNPTEGTSQGENPRLEGSGIRSPDVPQYWAEFPASVPVEPPMSSVSSYPVMHVLPNPPPGYRPQNDRGLGLRSGYDGDVPPSEPRPDWTLLLNTLERARREMSPFVPRTRDQHTQEDTKCKGKGRER